MRGLHFVNFAGVAVGFQRQILLNCGQLLIELALGCQVVEHDVRDARLALQGGEIRHPGGVDAGKAKDGISVLLFHRIFQDLRDFLHLLRVCLIHPTVIGEETVDLILHVRNLGDNGGAKALLHSRQYLIEV